MSFDSVEEAISNGKNGSMEFSGKKENLELGEGGK